MEMSCLCAKLGRGMPAPSEFPFRDPGPLIDHDLSVVLKRRTPPDPAKDWVAAYDFALCQTGTDDAVGNVSFRAQPHPMLELYRGHIGYNVDPNYRGRHFAERAVRLLLPFIRVHGFSAIWITCNPTNWPSRRTCERLGATLVEIVPLPPSEEMYAKGDREKCRYRLDL